MKSVERNKKNAIFGLIDGIIDMMSRILPKSKYNLPLNFEGKQFYKSKMIVLTSILVSLIIIWNAVQNIDKIGTITNIFYYEHEYQNNAKMNQ